jgi:uncharacterized metal-binding protein
MPGYRTHDKVGIAAIIPITGASLYFGHTIQDTITLTIGIAVSTYFLSPDLDLHSRIYNRWGFLRWIWIPYQKVIPHRSWLSHSGPISATLRIAYLFLWLLPLFLYLHVRLPVYDLQFVQFCVILWIAIMIADSLHVLMDMVWKDRK